MSESLPGLIAERLQSQSAELKDILGAIDATVRHVRPIDTETLSHIDRLVTALFCKLEEMERELRPRSGGRPKMHS